jgi:hypothetical protein
MPKPFAKESRGGNKYGAQKTVVDGITFDSKKEAEYYQQLKVLGNARSPENRVVDVQRQPSFDCYVNGHKVCRYTADFWVQYANGVEEYIDVKSAVTRKQKDYVIRKKLVKALFDVDIVER